MKPGDIYKKDGITYLVVDNDSIKKFKPFGDDRALMVDGTLFTFGKSENTIDTSLVTDANSLFEYAHKFNEDLSHWNTSNITNMLGMFCYAKSFDQDLSGWDVSNVTDMSWMFFDAKKFNQDLSGWDVRKVRYMVGMFDGAVSMYQEHKPRGAK